MGLLTLGIAALKIGRGCMYNHLHRLALRNAIPHQRAGRIRLVSEADLPLIAQVCERAGYLSPTEVPLEIR